MSLAYIAQVYDNYHIEYVIRVGAATAVLKKLILCTMIRLSLLTEAGSDEKGTHVALGPCVRTVQSTPIQNWVSFR